jgi:DNA modification methylase
VLDPFLGSGTTAMVALELGRKAIGIELNPEYVKLAQDRCNVTPGLAL